MVAVVGVVVGVVLVHAVRFRNGGVLTCNAMLVPPAVPALGVATIGPLKLPDEIVKVTFPQLALAAQVLGPLTLGVFAPPYCSEGNE